MQDIGLRADSGSAGDTGVGSERAGWVRSYARLVTGDSSVEAQGLLHDGVQDGEAVELFGVGHVFGWCGEGHVW